MTTLKTKRCDHGSLSDSPCHDVAEAFFIAGNHSAHPGREMHVCLDHGIDAFNEGYEVTNAQGFKLVAPDDEYVWEEP